MIEVSLKLFDLVDRSHRAVPRSASPLRWFSDAYTAMLKDSRMLPRSNNDVAQNFSF